MSRAKHQGSVGSSPSPAATVDCPEGVMESVVGEAMDRVIRLLWRNCPSVQVIEQAFHRACSELPRKEMRRERRIKCELLNASHALTVWFSDPEFLDLEGRPQRLPLHGPVSLETLARQAGLTLSAQELLKYLIRVNGVRRIGHRYVPRRRGAALLGTGPLAEAHHLRCLLGLLRTLDTNRDHAGAQDGEEMRLVTVVENPAFPKRAKGVFQAGVSREANQLLEEIDTRMLRHERRRKPGEPTVLMGVGVFQFEEERSGKLLERGSRKRSRRRLPGKTARRPRTR